MNRYDIALGKKPRPEDLKNKQRTQDPEHVSGLFNIKVEPMPMERPVGLAFALRVIYDDEDNQSAMHVIEPIRGNGWGR